VLAPITACKAVYALYGAFLACVLPSRVSWCCGRWLPALAPTLLTTPSLCLPSGLPFVGMPKMTRVP